MTKSGYTLVEGGTVLDAAGGTVSRRDILIEDDTILAGAPPGIAAPADCRRIDASDRLIIPGLINTHTHGHGALGKGRGDLWTLELLLNAGPWISGKRTLEDKRLAARLNAVEMALKGCTCCYDLYFEFPTPTREGIEAVVLAYAEVGVRAVIAPMVADISLYEALPGLIETLPRDLRKEAQALALDPFERSLSSNRDILENWSHDRKMARPAVAPTIPQHCSEAYLAACGELARAHGVGIHMHLAESRTQHLVAIEKYGMSQTAYLDKLGLLGPQFVGAHCVWLTDDDIERIAARGGSITHQPICNLRLGSGIAPVRKFLDRKIAVGIGTDGSNASDSQNMFEAIRQAANVSRVVTGDLGDWLSAHDALMMATVNGAAITGFDGRLGRIAQGYLADLVFLDLSSVNYVPLNNAAYQVVNSEDSSSVDSVMVGGRMVVEKRNPANVDMPNLRRSVEEAIARLDRATRPTRDVAMRLETFVSGYCRGFAASRASPM